MTRQRRMWQAGIAIAIAWLAWVGFIPWSAVHVDFTSSPQLMTLEFGTFHSVHFEQALNTTQTSVVAGTFAWRILPFGLIASVVFSTILFIPAYLLWRWVVRNGAIVGQCDQCGYSLHGLVANRCPECGERVDSDIRAAARGQAIHSFLLQASLICLTMFGLMLLPVHVVRLIDHLINFRAWPTGGPSSSAMAFRWVSEISNYGLLLGFCLLFGWMSQCSKSRQNREPRGL
jgi:hypothetical protein